MTHEECVDGVQVDDDRAVDRRVRCTHGKQFISIADATVTSDGIVIAATSSPSAIVALDFSNGNVVWTIPAPSPNSCLLGATLTSDSTVVGVQCDGTVFGASD